MGRQGGSQLACVLQAATRQRAAAAWGQAVPGFSASRSVQGLR